MNKQKLVILSIATGLLLTLLSALIRTNTGSGPVCGYSSGSGPLDELAIKVYPQKQIGLPLPYYVLPEPDVGCFDITDRPVFPPGLQPIKLAADIVFWASLTAGAIVLTQKARNNRHG